MRWAGDHADAETEVMVRGLYVLGVSSAVVGLLVTMAGQAWAGLVICALAFLLVWRGSVLGKMAEGWAENAQGPRTPLRAQHGTGSLWRVLDTVSELPVDYPAAYAMTLDPSLDVDSARAIAHRVMAPRWADEPTVWSMRDILLAVQAEVTRR